MFCPPEAKPEILDYGATCIRFVLNRRNCVGELDKTGFVTSPFACAKCFPSCLHKLRFAKVSMGKNIFSFFFLFYFFFLKNTS